MKKTWTVPLFLVLALVVCAAPGSATIVFTAFADLSFYDAPCTPPGTLMSIEGYHSGSLHSMDAGDYGRNFDLDGTTKSCSFSVTHGTCGDFGTAGVDNNVFCATYFEQMKNMCSSRSYKATASVQVTDGGGESAYDESSCQSC